MVWLLEWLFYIFLLLRLKNPSMDITHFDKYSIINCNNLDSFNLLITFLKKQTTNYPNLIINMTL